MWPSIVAVLGTLAGAAMTFMYQDRLDRRARRHAIVDRSHAERREACAALGSALIAYRHSQLARRSHRLIHQDDSSTLRDEVRHARGESWSAAFRVELLTGDVEVRTATETCMEQIRQFKYAKNPAELDHLADNARGSIRALIELCRTKFLSDGARNS